MRLTQAQMARELHISRATMSTNVKAGCPLTSVGEAKHWRACNVREKFNQEAHDAEMRSRPRQTVPSTFDDEPTVELRELSRPVTHAEFAAALEAEFRRFEIEAPQRKKDGNLPTSFCPALMLGVWACRGFMAYGGNNDPHEVALIVNILMSEVRDGNGDYLYRGLSDDKEAKLSKGFVMLLEAEEMGEKRIRQKASKAKPKREKVPSKG